MFRPHQSSMFDLHKKQRFTTA